MNQHCYNCGMERFEGMVHHGVPYGPCEYYVVEPTRPLTDAELLTGKHSMSLTCPNYAERIKSEEIEEALEGLPEKKELKPAGAKFGEAQAKVSNWVASLVSEKRTGSAIIAGPTGTGKSTLFKNVLRDLVMVRKEVRWILFPVFLKTLKDTWSKDYAGPSESHILLDTLECDLLVIDDLGAETFSRNENQWVREIVFTIFNEAIESPRLSLGISTNLTSAEMEDRYGDRVVSRMRQLANEHDAGFMHSLSDTPDFRRGGFKG